MKGLFKGRPAPGRLRVRSLRLLSLAVCALALGAPGAWAASAPQIKATWVTDVTATSANLRAEIDSPGQSATYRFEYLSLAAYEANIKAAKDPFTGASKAPIGGVAVVKAGTLTQHITGLAPATSYRFRALATNPSATTTGPERSLGSQEATNAFALLDNRGWEIVSPIDKNGGSVQPPEAIFGGGVFQAAANGQSITYSSADSFQAGQGAPPGSQYLATRGSSGWQNQNISTPLLSGSYGEHPNGVPYQLFSADLSQALLSNGQRCRGEVGQCPVANPPLPGSGAVAGYRDYYRRQSNGAFSALITAADLTHTSLGPQQFELSLAGTSTDLSHVVLSSCAALSADAVEVPAPGGCVGQNLYEASQGSLRAINLAPGEVKTTPGAQLGAPSGAISTDGSHIYFSELEDGPIYLSQAGKETKLLPETIGGGASFQVASSDGSFAFFTKAGHLYRYSALANTSTDLTPSAGTQGVLGASGDGSHVYYLSTSGLFVWNAGNTSEVAAGADPGDYPPATGTARVSTDGTHLLFLSSEELSGYESNGQSEVFLYGPKGLSCLSCNPTGERPQGASGIPGAIANGQAQGATQTYKPRVLSANANRVFFESADDLVPQDSNNATDVYEWESQGEGSCVHQGGCVQLISSGRGEGAAAFADASADGSDAFFLTDSSLAFADPGSFDVYVARIDGGFLAPHNEIACDGDACQPLPEAPEDPTPGTLIKGPGNPPRRFVKPSGQKQGKAKGKQQKQKQHHKKHGGKK